MRRTALRLQRAAALAFVPSGLILYKNTVIEFHPRFNRSDPTVSEGHGLGTLALQAGCGRARASPLAVVLICWPPMHTATASAPIFSPPPWPEGVRPALAAVSQPGPSTQAEAGVASGAADPPAGRGDAAPWPGRAAAAAESACARPDVWRADALSAAPARVCASGHAALDAVLPGGGWPLGALVELLQQAPVQAVWRLLAPALATLDGAVVLVGAPLPPFAPALEAQGLAAQRLLWVRADTAAERAWAAEQALACAEVGAVLLWLHEAPPSVRPPIATAGSSAAVLLAARRNPSARAAVRPGTGEAPSPSRLLRRLHLAAQGRGKLLVALRPEAARHTPSCAVLRLALQEDEAAANVSSVPTATATAAPAPAPAPAPAAPARPVPATASVRASGRPNASVAGHRPGHAATGPAADGPATAACADGPGLRVQVLKRRGPPLEAPLHLPRHGTALQALLAAQQTYRARLRSGWNAEPRPAPLRPARSRTAVAQPAALAVGAPG